MPARRRMLPGGGIVAHPVLVYTTYACTPAASCAPVHLCVNGLHAILYLERESKIEKRISAKVSRGAGGVDVGRTG